MLSTPEKTIILAGSLFGSVILFSTALYNINNISINRYNNTNDSVNNKLIVINGITMLFSAATFGYFTFIAIK
jgi:hypothetical protein